MPYKPLESIQLSSLPNLHFHITNLCVTVFAISVSFKQYQRERKRREKEETAEVNKKKGEIKRKTNNLEFKLRVSWLLRSDYAWAVNTHNTRPAKALYYRHWQLSKWKLSNEVSGIGGSSAACIQVLSMIPDFSLFVFPMSLKIFRRILCK